MMPVPSIWTVKLVPPQNLYGTMEEIWNNTMQRKIALIANPVNLRVRELVFVKRVQQALIPTWTAPRRQQLVSDATRGNINRRLDNLTALIAQ